MCPTESANAIRNGVKGESKKNGNGVMTGRCVIEDQKTGIKTYQIVAWCSQIHSAKFCRKALCKAQKSVPS